uniref:BPL/LPL catalytic domain-containing protein n=1 Tax=Kalanchoe fedtschenkoi TaxID=63787 RepID=A0A7N0ULP1_KALFE
MVVLPPWTSSRLLVRCLPSFSSSPAVSNFRLHSHSVSAASSSAAMDSLLVLAGKSDAEVQLAESLKRNNTLKLPDDARFSISVHENHLTPTTTTADSFSITDYMTLLNTGCFGRLLIWSPRLPSTHDIVSQNFCELPVGSVCIADVQYKGRGRSKNVWESPPGCLMFSFTVQMEDGRVVPLLQYVVSLAVTEALEDVCRAHGLPPLDVKIKWPNDLYLCGLKVGGILCTSTYKEKKFNVSAGIGLNVDNEKPSTCLNDALQELTSGGTRLKKEELVAAFFNKFEVLFQLFNSQGFQALEKLYYNTWLHSGQKVIIQEKAEDQLVENVVTIQGLTSSGYLLAFDENNEMYELHPDGNSFDFFKGLIRRKLQ